MGNNLDIGGATAEAPTPTSENAAQPEMSETEPLAEAGTEEEFFAGADAAKEQNEDYIDLVKGRDYFEVGEEGNRVVEELKGNNAEIDELQKGYESERQAILGKGERLDQLQPLSPAVVDQKTSGEKAEPQQLAESERLKELAPLHPAVIESGVGRAGNTEAAGEQNEKEGEKVAVGQAQEGQQEMEAVLEVFQKAGYSVESKADLATIPAKLIAELPSYPDKSLVLPEAKLALVDQLNAQNMAELNKLIALEYKIMMLPLEKDDRLSQLIYLIKMLVGGQSRYMLLVRPEYYNRTNQKGEAEVALALQNVADKLDAQVKVVPRSESEAVESNIVQLGDGKTLLPEGTPETQGLLESGIGKENLLLTPPGEGFKLESLPFSSASIPSLSAGGQ